MSLHSFTCGALSPYKPLNNTASMGSGRPCVFTSCRRSPLSTAGHITKELAQALYSHAKYTISCIKRGLKSQTVEFSYRPSGLSESLVSLFRRNTELTLHRNLKTSLMGLGDPPFLRRLSCITRLAGSNKIYTFTSGVEQVLLLEITVTAWAPAFVDEP